MPFFVRVGRVQFEPNSSVLNAWLSAIFLHWKYEDNARLARLGGDQGPYLYGRSITVVSGPKRCLCHLGGNAAGLAEHPEYCMSLVAHDERGGHIVRRSNLLADFVDDVRRQGDTEWVLTAYVRRDGLDASVPHKPYCPVHQQC
jgi:hypothetical protein